MPESKRPKSTPGKVQSLVRSLDLLKTIAAQRDGMILRDISIAVDLPVSTTHRLLTTLEGENFVRANAATGAWTIGSEAFKTGLGFLQSRDIGVLAHPFLRRLTQRWSETASLYIEADGEVVCISQVESKQMMRAVARVGGCVSMHSTSAGKAILAALPLAEIDRIIGERGLQRNTKATLSSRSALDADLEAVRKRGWAVDDEEFVEGVRCTGAVVRNHENRPIAAISMSGPVGRISPDTLTAIGENVALVASQLSVEMGYQS